MLAGAEIGALQHGIERLPENATALSRPLRLDHGSSARSRVISILGRVQPGPADGDTLDQPDAFEPPLVALEPRKVGIALAIDQIARGQHLGQDRGDDLERLDIVLAVELLRRVLHHQHADHAAAALHRHTQEGVVDVLAGLREIGEIGVRLGRRRC